MHPPGSRAPVLFGPNALTPLLPHPHLPFDSFFLPRRRHSLPSSQDRPDVSHNPSFRGSETSHQDAKFLSERATCPSAPNPQRPVMHSSAPLFVAALVLAGLNLAAGADSFAIVGAGYCANAGDQGFAVLTYSVTVNDDSACMTR